MTTIQNLQQTIDNTNSLIMQAMAAGQAVPDVMWASLAKAMEALAAASAAESAPAVEVNADAEGNAKTEQDESCEHVQFEKDYSGIVNGDYSSITCAEDIDNDALYEAMYAPGTNDRARATIKRHIKEMAQKIGGRNLASTFKELSELKEKEMQKRKAKDKESSPLESKYHYTGFRGLPEDCTGNKLVTRQWIAEDNKIFRWEETKGGIKEVKAATQPILINKIINPIDSSNGGKQVELLFYNGTNWQYKIVGLQTILNAQKAMSLGDDGFNITQSNSREFCEFMSDMYACGTNTHTIPIQNTLSQMGWNDDCTEFMPYTNKDYIFDRADSFHSLMDDLAEKGDRDIWYHEFGELRKLNYLPFKFAYDSLLAAPILGMMPNLNGFICSVYGPSTTGKSPNNLIAATIWGNGDVNKDYVYSPYATNCGLEVRLGVLKNIPLVIEDLSQLLKQEKESFQSVAMKISIGKSKGRARQDLSERKGQPWRTTALVNAEQDITRGWGTSGSIARVLQVTVDERVEFFDDIPRLMEVFDGNYGHCGRDFIKVLIQLGRDEVKRRVRENIDRVKALAEEHGKQMKQATNVAILLTADEIAAEFIFHDDIKLTDNEMLSIMQDEIDTDQYRRFYEDIIDTMQQNPMCFQGIAPDDYNIVKFYGKLERDVMVDEERTNETVLSIQPGFLKKMMADQDVDRRLFMMYLSKRKLLIHDKGTYTIKVDTKIGRMRMVSMIIPSMDDKSDDKENGSSDNKTKTIGELKKEGINTPDLKLNEQDARLRNDKTRAEAIAACAEDNYKSTNANENTMAEDFMIEDLPFI